ATNSTHSYPRARKSTPSNSGSPQPSRTGAIAMCSSSMRPSRRYSLDCVRPTADPHVHSGSGLACTVERLANASCYEVERRVAFHLDGRARVMSQDESWNVIRWVVPPPAFPVHVGPGTANPNMFLPRIQAPTFLKPRAAKSS